MRFWNPKAIAIPILPKITKNVLILNPILVKAKIRPIRIIR
jgi:hypothetical protein